MSANFQYSLSCPLNLNWYLTVISPSNQSTKDVTPCVFWGEIKIWCCNCLLEHVCLKKKQKTLSSQMVGRAWSYHDVRAQASWGRIQKKKQAQSASRCSVEYLVTPITLASLLPSSMPFQTSHYWCLLGSHMDNTESKNMSWEITLVLTWKLHPCWLTLTALEGTVHTASGGKSSSILAWLPF